MSDILDFISSTAPRRAPLALEVTAELTPEDLELLKLPVAVEPRPVLEHIRAVHHVQARLIADGKSANAVAAIVGSSPARVKLLLGDPAFMELVAYYTDQKDVLWMDTQQMLALLGRSAAQELQRRLDEKPDTFSNNELKNVMESAMDRSDAPDKRQNAPNIVVTFKKPETIIEGTVA